MTQHSGDDLSAMRHALAEAETFTRAQVADLLSRAFAFDLNELMWQDGYAAGYRARVAEENAAYPPEPHKLVTTAGQDAIRVHRARAGVDIVEPREGDFPGYGIEHVRAMKDGWPE